MIRPGSRKDMVEVPPNNFERIQHAKDLHTNFNLIQKKFIRSPRSILLGHDLAYEALEARPHWKINAVELYFYRSEFWHRRVNQLLPVQTETTFCGLAPENSARSNVPKSNSHLETVASVLQRSKQLIPK
jgi:hypothetical protein